MPFGGPGRLPRLDMPPWRLSGVVVAALLNHVPQLAALGDAVDRPPYKAPPRHPVLALRPRHMLGGDGDAITLPEGIDGVDVGASLGIVIGRAACRVCASEALAFVAGYLIVHDVRLPLASHYRPALRQTARDGYSPLGALVVPAAAVPDPDALAVRVCVDGALVQATDTADRIRGVARLIADVSDFMTLQPGDVLTLGAAHGAPRVRAGQTVVSEIEGLGRLSNPVVAGAAGAA